MSPDEPCERDEQWELNHLHTLIYDEIGMCGCGWSDAAYDLIRDLLDHFHDRDQRNIVEMIGGHAAAQIVLYRLQDADLIDHGTSVTSSWITGKGRYARHLMHKHPALVEHAGYPDCWDNERGRCPEQCWTPPAGVPEQPPGPSTDELMARLQREADEARARMNPIERAIHDETDARMESYLLFGTPEPPEVVGEPGALMRGAGIDVQAEADRIRARIEAARRAGTEDLLRQLGEQSPGISPATSTALREAMNREGLKP